MSLSKINKLSFSLFYLAIIIYSCNSKKADHTNCNSLPVSKISKIDVNNKQYNHQSYQIIEVNKKPLLYCLDIPGSSINIFDLENSQFLYNIDFSAEKLNINQIDQFYVHNQDSIFLYSMPLNILYLINSEDELTDSWEFDLHVDSLNPNLPVFNVLASPNYYSGFVYDANSNNFISTIFLFDGQNFLNENAYDYPPIGKIHLTSDEQSPVLTGQFPPSYNNREVPFDIYYSLEKRNDNILLNYSFSSKVFIAEDNSFHEIKSNYEEEFIIYPKGKDPEIKKVLEYINTGLVYLRTFELDNGKLIRVCKLPQQLQDKNGLYNQFVQSPWSIIVYDKSTQKVLNEYCFEANMYDFRCILPYKSGFYALKENPFDELNNEEVLEIQYYNIK